MRQSIGDVLARPRQSQPQSSRVSLACVPHETTRLFCTPQTSRVSRKHGQHTNNAVNAATIKRDVVVIGASAGGIEAVVKLLSWLPVELPASLCIVIHRGSRSATNWSDMLGKQTELQVIEPATATPLLHAHVYVAPSDRHMTLEHGTIMLNEGPRQHYTRPAIDPLFASAAREYGPRVLGVLLTGGASDGTQGFLDITTAGGITLVQNPAEAMYS